MIFIAGILGWLLGVAINATADSLPYSRHISAPHCLACGAPRALPAWSSLILLAVNRGECDYCRTRARLRNLVVEVIGAIGAIALWVWAENAAGFWSALVICAVFLLIAVIDIEQRLILHVVTVPAALVFFIIGALNPGLGWRRTLVGGGLGFGIFYLLYILGGVFARWTASRRGMDDDEVALGFGDVTLSTLIGLVVGFPAVIEALLRGILYAGVISIVVIVVMLVRKRYTAFQPIPYGPFLILGSLWVYFQGWTTLERLLGM